MTDPPSSCCLTGHRECEREASRSDPRNVLLSTRLREFRLEDLLWMFERQREKVFMPIVALPLRQWKDLERLEATSECLGSAGKRVVAGRAGEDKSAGVCGPVQLRLHRLEYLRRLLVFVNEHHLRTGNSSCHVGAHRVQCGEVI